MKALILASQSPRRQTLLTQLGYEFITQVADIDESVQGHETPQQYVLRLSQEKARFIFEKLTDQEHVVVLGADTCVVQHDHILGKPENEQACIQTLSALSGNTHQVYTGIAAISKENCISQVVSTQVSFKALDEAEIKRYWHTKEPCDKAGAYAIQGIGGQFVTNINGSYSSVVGLPLYETAQILATLKVINPIQIG